MPRPKKSANTDKPAGTSPAAERNQAADYQSVVDRINELSSRVDSLMTQIQSVRMDSPSGGGDVPQELLRRIELLESRIRGHNARQ